MADADRPEPVPMYGYHNALIDHFHQTFNGLLATNVNGCVARWPACDRDP